MIEESDAVFARAWAACFLDEYAAEVPGADQETADEYEGYEEYEELETDFELGDGYSLHITSWSYGSSLSLRHPGAAEPVEIGAEDLVTWQPHTLRWPEADLLCRAAALADPDAIHPGPRLALLGRFAPICTDRDAEVAVPLLHASFATLTELDAYQRRAYATHNDVRTYGVDWRRDAENGPWYFDDSAEENPYRDDPDAADHRTGELYSMRDREHDEFPFAALASAVERARARCAMVREQPWARRPGVGLGSTRHGPARVGRLDGTYVDDLPLILIDDWQAATEVIRDVLLAAKVPQGTGIRVSRRGETIDIPLRPDTPIEPDR